MRLTQPLPLPDMKPLLARAEPAFAGLRSALHPLGVAAGRGADIVRPYVERADRALRKYPKVAAALDRVAAVWATLVDAFCATIDPYISRWFPDLRLVATATDTGALAIHRVGKGETTDLGALESIDGAQISVLAAMRWSGIELRLRPDQVLQRSLALPGASREFLAPIIEHRLERLTPWRPDKVLYGFRVEDDPANAGALAVTLVATSRDTVAPLLQRLGEAGFVPSAIGAATPDGPMTPLAINLMTGGAKAPRADSRRLVSRVVLIALVGLTVAYCVTATMASNAIADQDASSRKLTKARRLLRNATIGNLGSQERAMLDAKQPEHSSMVLVDKLAAAIPETTFLKEMEIAPDKVHLVGTSSDAPGLVAKLEAIGLGNVRFTSSITREKDGRDNFEIGADRAPPAPAEEP